MAVSVLCESGGALRSAPGGKWLTSLITPGKGSSGTYSESVLQEYGAAAFPAGTKLWFGHPEDLDPGSRDARDQWGFLEEDAFYDDGALQAKVSVLPHWKEVIDSLGTQAALSVFVRGDSDEAGNVITLNEHFTNSVDIVSYPGRSGSGLKQKLEAARAAGDSGAAAASGSQKEENMDELKALLESLVSKFDTFLAERAAADDAATKAEAAANAEEKDVATAVEAAITAVEAVKAAKLLPSLEAPLIEAAKSGADISKGIEAASKIMSEAVSAAAPKGPQPYVIESASADDSSHDFTVGRLIGV